MEYPDGFGGTRSTPIGFFYPMYEEYNASKGQRDTLRSIMQDISTASEPLINSMPPLAMLGVDHFPTMFGRISP